MKRNIQLSNEIERLRAEVNKFINENGLSNCETLLKLSSKLDSAIVKWVKEDTSHSDENIYIKEL